jgi:hypothetical protein
MPIVTGTYRYKRPPEKRKPVAIEGPAIVTSVDPKKSRRDVPRDGTAAQVRGARSLQTKRAGDAQPNTAAPVSASAPKRSAIVTMRSAGEDMTPEEHKRRGDRPTRCSARSCAGSRTPCTLAGHDHRR